MFQLTLARRKVLWAYAFLLIPLIFFICIRIYPTLFAMQISFFDWSPLATEQKYVGLENYQMLLEDSIFPFKFYKSL